MDALAQLRAARTAREAAESAAQSGGTVTALQRSVDQRPASVTAMHPSPAAPCPACSSPIFWTDAYSNIRCHSCSPPPSAALARSRLCVISLGASDPKSDQPQYAWADFDAEVEACQVRWRRQREREQSASQATATVQPETESRGITIGAHGQVILTVPPYIPAPSIDDSMRGGWTIDEWWDELDRHPRRIELSEEQKDARGGHGIIRHQGKFSELKIDKDFSPDEPADKECVPS